MARRVKLAPTEKPMPKAKQVVAPSRLGGIRRNLPTIFGAAALVAAGALAGTALAHDEFNGRSGHPAGPGMEARMNMHGGQMAPGMGAGGMRGPGGDQDGNGRHAAGRPRAARNLVGTVASSTATELSVTLADGTTKVVTLSGTSQYFTQTPGSTTDVTVGSYVLVSAKLPGRSATQDVTSIAVLANGLTTAHVHLGHPAKVTAVNGSALTLEVAMPRGTKTITVTIGANTSISTISAATSADLTVGTRVAVDLGRGTLAAESVLIVK